MAHRGCFVLVLALPVAAIAMDAWGEPSKLNAPIVRPVEARPVRAVASKEAFRKLATLPASATNDLKALLRAASDAVGASSTTGLFEVMLEFQKLADKETREDQRLSKMALKLALEDRAAKLKLDNQSIDDGMKEAGEKADNLMQAATASLIMGCIAGIVSLGGGVASAERDGGVASIVASSTMGPLSPFQAAAAMDVVGSNALSAPVRTRLRERASDVLTIVVDFSKTRGPLGPALRGLFAKDPVLASADSKWLLPLAIVDSYLAAMEQLRSAYAHRNGKDAPSSDLELAERRAIAILEVLRAMTRQLV